MSELKVLAHLGEHSNIVNLLGAVTARLVTSNRQLVKKTYRSPRVLVTNLVTNLVNNLVIH